MNNTHTPGPWKVSDEIGLGNFSSRYEVRADAIMNDNSIKKGALVASCAPYSWEQHQGPTYHECRANAQLIASAPDLLEALKALIGSSDATSQVVITREEVVEQGLKAIRKAEGK